MFVKVIRMSHATDSINNGDGNVPKAFPDGTLYGSSQSTKRQIMEASGVTIYGHFDISDGQTNKIDGAFGTTGHRGIEKHKIAKDFFITKTIDDDKTKSSNHIGPKYIAADEYYWSVYTFNYNLYPEITKSLNKIVDACMTKVLHPHANKNKSELSIEWAIKVTNLNNANINLPKIKSDRLENVLPIIKERNPDCQIEVYPS